MTDAERKWLESRGWIKADLSKGWHHARLGWREKTGEPWLIDGDDAVGIERAAFEAECLDLWRLTRAATQGQESCPDYADWAVDDYRQRFGPQAFEIKSVEATNNQEVEQ